ncbi:PLC-like phosphodiesterase, partial [Sistotremastrum suecicum HHB10207 ss-3]
LLILPIRPLHNFLASLPDSLPLSSLTLPGTHDSLAFYGWPISQCQSPSTPLQVQLNSGIRVLDVRLAIIDNTLISYHGIFPQRTPFSSILSTTSQFLSSNPSETLIISIKQEDYSTNPPSLFNLLVAQEIATSDAGFDIWFLENRCPTLGQVRGKCILLSRFGADGENWPGGLDNIGIHPSKWPDSESKGFNWLLNDTLVRTQDWYAIPSFLSIPEKTTLASQILLTPQQTPLPILNITYTSAASIPLALPPHVAKGFGFPQFSLGYEGVNVRFARWLMERIKESMEPDENEKGRWRVRGWVLMDYYDEPIKDILCPLLVEFNFLGRTSGEEGWP